MKALLRAFVLAAAIVTWAVPASADVLPEPQRPSYDEHPAPMPDPPPDRAVARLALLVAAAGLAGGVWTLSRRRPAARAS